MSRIPILLALLLAGVASAGGYVPDKHVAASYLVAKAKGADSATNPKQGDVAAIAAGKALYAQRCVACHGAGAQGDGPAAVAFDPRPADFTDKARWGASSVGFKEWIVINGIKNTGMAATGASDEEAWDILAYLEDSYQR